MKSFYEYPTLHPENLTFSSEASFEGPPISPEPSKEVAQNVFSFQRKAPSYNDVLHRLGDIGVFNTRPVKGSLVYGVKADAEADKGIDLGVHKVKVPWKHDLPTFTSDFTNDACSLTEPLPFTSGSRVVLQFVRKAPTRQSVIKRAAVKEGSSLNAGLANEGHKETLDTPDEDCVDINKTIIRIRRDSEDSIGSEISCSPTSEASPVKILTPKSPEPEKHELSNPPKLLGKRRISWDSSVLEGSEKNSQKPLILKNQTLLQLIRNRRSSSRSLEKDDVDVISPSQKTEDQNNQSKCSQKIVLKRRSVSQRSINEASSSLGFFPKSPESKSGNFKTDTSVYHPNVSRDPYKHKAKITSRP